MKHAPTVVIASRQRSEHGYSSLRYETCSDSCHRLMTMVREWLFIPKVWNMLWQLASSHDNGQSMVIHLLNMKHAPSVDIVSWQRSEHGYSFLRYETGSESCHLLNDNGQSMVIHPEGMKHAPTVDIVSWQRTEHGYSSLKYETCSDSCHRDMTTVRAWLFISKVWNMLRQLTSSHDNGQSIVIHL